MGWVVSKQTPDNIQSSERESAVKEVSFNSNVSLGECNEAGVPYSLTSANTASIRWKPDLVKDSSIGEMSMVLSDDDGHDKSIFLKSHDCLKEDESRTSSQLCTFIEKPCISVAENCNFYPRTPNYRCKNFIKQSIQRESLVSLTSERLSKLKVSKINDSKVLNSNKLNYVEFKDCQKVTAHTPHKKQVNLNLFSNKVKPILNPHMLRKEKPITLFEPKSKPEQEKPLFSKHLLPEKCVDKPKTPNNPYHSKHYMSLYKKTVKRLPPIVKEAPKPNNTKVKSKFSRKTIAKNGINTEMELKGIKINDESLLDYVEERILSPLMLSDVDKCLTPSADEYELHENLKDTATSHTPPIIRHKRPHTSCGSNDVVNKENFQFIVKDFNEKIDSLIKETRSKPSLCTSCQNDNTVSKNSATAGKITFFFLKRYGNFGKFLLARLNEFLDSVYNEKPTPDYNCNKQIAKDFPLPCNIRDIEYTAKLKSKPILIDNIKTNIKLRSRLPKLIVKRNINLENSDVGHEENECDMESFTRSLNDGECKLDNCERKTKKGNEINVHQCLPPLKSAASSVTFIKRSNCADNELNLGEVCQTIDISNSDFKIFSYEEICDAFKDEVGQTPDKNDIDSSNRDTFEDFNKQEENVSRMANYLLDDLWKNNNIKALPYAD